MLALARIASLVGGRWRASRRDALARVVVTSVLGDDPPAFLTDAGLTRCIDRLLEARGPVSIDELRRGTELAADDADPSTVAARAGFSTTSSMRRSLRRVRAPRVRVPSVL